MKITIIIPSFNQGDYLPETLDTVLSQTGADIEVLLFDGGSTDNTLEVVKKYQRHLVYWESCQDRGQTHAINKGLARATGDAWVYLNSDDLLVANAVRVVAEQFRDPKVMWVAGNAEVFDECGTRGQLNLVEATDKKQYLTPWSRVATIFPFSGSSYFRADVHRSIGLLNESYHYSMDVEFYCRAIFKGNIAQTIFPETLARWRWHAASKTMSRGIAYAFREEELKIAQEYALYLPQEARAELQSEIKAQLLAMTPRRAMWLLAQNERLAAFRELTRGAMSMPHSLIYRPWLGAFRRVLVGAQSSQ